MDDREPLPAPGGGFPKSEGRVSPHTWPHYSCVWVAEPSLGARSRARHVGRVKSPSHSVIATRGWPARKWGARVVRLAQGPAADDTTRTSPPPQGGSAPAAFPDPPQPGALVA